MTQVLLYLLLSLRASAAPLPDGIFETGPEESVSISLSVWQKDGKRSVRLICHAGCVHPDPENGTLESYSGEASQDGETTQAVLKFEAGPGPVRARPVIRVRITWKDRAVIEFNGKKTSLEKRSFRQSMYRFMGGYADAVSFLFFPDSARDGVLLKPPDENGAETEWIYMHGGRAKPARFNNWRWVPGKSDHEMSYFMQLVGDYALPGGETGEIKADVLRSPVSDIGFRLFPRGKRPQRFWQSNDSNTTELSSCVPRKNDAQCILLFRTLTETRNKCTRASEPSFVFLIYAPLAGTVETYAMDEKAGKLLNAACKPVYSIQTDEASGAVTLKGPRILRFLPFPVPESSQ